MNKTIRRLGVLLVLPLFLLVYPGCESGTQAVSKGAQGVIAKAAQVGKNLDGIDRNLASALETKEVGPNALGFPGGGRGSLLPSSGPLAGRGSVRSEGSRSGAQDQGRGEPVDRTSQDLGSSPRFDSWSGGVGVSGSRPRVTSDSLDHPKADPSGSAVSGEAGSGSPRGEPEQPATEQQHRNPEGERAGVRDGVQDGKDSDTAATRIIWSLGILVTLYVAFIVWASRRNPTI